MTSITPDAFAGFWEMQGHRVVKTATCHWYDAQPWAFLSIPYHWHVSPSPRELVQLLLLGAAVRYPAPANTSHSAESGLFVRSGKNYDFSALHPKARNQTRRGLERCSVEQVEFSWLAEHGASLNEDTMRRQERDPESMNRNKWKKYCDAASRTSGFEAWAAFVDGSLASFAATALIEDCFSILHQASATQFLDQCPNNALVFSLTRAKLSDTQVAYISYGLKSIDKTDTLNHFKSRMGFTLRPFHDRLVLNPAVKGFLRLGGRHLVQAMARRHPQNDTLRKASRAIQSSAEELSA